MNVREHVLNALIQIEKNNAYSNIVVKEYLRKYSFTIEDKSLFTNIVYGVTTHRKYLYFVLQQYVKRPHKQIFWIKNLLLMSAYQILFLDIPNFAVTSESVKIAKGRGGPVKGNFINGVLRSIIRDKGLVVIPEDNITSYLSIKYSLQEWMIEEFKRTLEDENELEALCASFNETLPLSLRVNTLRTSREELMAKLEELGVKSAKSSICKDGIVLEPKVTVARIQRLLGQGLCIIQDQSSMKVSEILNPTIGDKVLDMCAAPGGKSTHIAQMMDNQGKVVSCDIHDHKIQLVQDLVYTLGINNVEAKKVDGTEAKAYFKEESFDKILVDAPCSGLGVMASKPDIKWNKSKDDLDDISKIQWKLLLNARALLKKGGTLVYSTCTLTTKENEEMITKFIGEFGEFKLLSQLKLYPHRDKCHGFYIAKLSKTR